MGKPARKMSWRFWKWSFHQGSEKIPVCDRQSVQRKIYDPEIWERKRKGKMRTLSQNPYYRQNCYSPNSCLCYTQPVNVHPYRPSTQPAQTLLRGMKEREEKNS